MVRNADYGARDATLHQSITRGIYPCGVQQWGHIISRIAAQRISISASQAPKQYDLMWSG